MQVKRFVAANMRLALKMVREEMGPDAIILSNKRVADGVELLISLETESVDDAVSKAVAQDSYQGQNAELNPFQQAVMDSDQGFSDDRKKRENIEREQQAAKKRAEELSKALRSKNTQQREDLLNATSLAASELGDALLSEDKVDFSTSFQTQLNKTEVTEPGYQPLQSEQESGRVQLEEEAKLSLVEHDKQLSDMRFELQSMRDLLEQQFKSMSWANFNQQSPKQASFWKRLKRMGIGSSVVQLMLDKYNLDSPETKQGATDTWQQLMTDLCQQLPVMQDDLIDKGGVFAFVGPTGAGKTTTIGKLAARYVLKHGADNIALVTTDTMRIAAHEQLRTFGRILNVPVKIVDKNNSLERVMYSLRHKSVVLIDTAGFNRQDDRLKQQLISLNEAGARLKTLLVMPATSQLAVIKSAFYSYKTDNLCACVMTKLDESASLGEVITLSIDKSLPIAYTTDGQGIPDDISVADSSHIVRSAIYLAKNTGSDESAMAEEFSGSSH